MAITVTCACGQGFRVKDDLAGKTIKCPKCSGVLTIPAAEVGELSLDDLMKMDAGAPAMPGMGMPAEQPGAMPGQQAQFPAGGGFVAPGAGGLQSPAFPFGQPAQAKSGSSGGSNKKLLILCGAGGFALLAVVGVVLMLVMGGDDKPAQTVTNSSTSPDTAVTQPITKQGTTTPAPSLALAALPPIKMEMGGRTTLDLKVERNGQEGAIQVQLANVPQGITATAAEIPAGQSAGKLDVVVSDISGMEINGAVEITIVAGQAQAKQSLTISVAKANLPAFEAVAEIFVQPGGAGSARLVLKRNGYVGPLEVRPEGISDKISLRATEIAAGQDESKLEITAAADAPEAVHSLRITGIAQDRNISLTIPLHVTKVPFRVKSFTVVQMKPGEQKMVQVAIERRNFNGPIQLAVDKLPEGVTIPNSEIPAGKNDIQLPMTATPTAKECIRTARVVGMSGNLSSNDALLVRVTRGETGFLPRELANTKEVANLLRRGSFGGRLTAEIKQALLEAYGGTPESEAAVLQGLRWLAAHQQSDGSWKLHAYNENIRNCDCHTGFEAKVQDNDTAGIAFGLLPFLGAGITQNRAPAKPAELAKYQRVVKDGLKALVKRQVLKDADPKKIGNLGGSMYSHALGTMTLCEAYGLSGDEELRIPTQRAVRYLLDSQHLDGGWRYGPNQPGDMSATGWVFLAIRDGQLASIPVGDEPLKRAEKFLDSVANGPPEAKLSQYAYEPGKDATLTLTAAGLLSRQYTGTWPREEPNLVAGAKFMMQHLPPEGGKALGPMYYYYYATQVLHHMEGEEFDLWNYRMREHLIRTQQISGHRAGSWEPEGCDWGASGGRLYSTALAILTLQVYYRHLPLYRSLNQIKPATKS